MVDILVVEDNKELAGLLYDFLCVQGYSVCIAENGEKALALYKDEGAKLVLLDIMLPGIDGFAVCSKIREDGNTPVIIISAKNDKQSELGGLNLGADDYIEKPYDIDILLAKIKGIFKRRYSDKDNRISCGNICLDKASHTVEKDGVRLHYLPRNLICCACLWKTGAGHLARNIFLTVYGAVTVFQNHRH